jgi:small subunit ribosomal protein S21
MAVVVHENDIEKALKIFKRQIQRQGLLKELKQRSYYEKPSEKRKRKLKAAKRRMAKLSQENNY